MNIQKTTPILSVKSIEECLPYWVEKLGYEATVKVPHGDRLGFVILKSGDSEIMLQTLASIGDDLPAVQKIFAERPVALYSDVKSLDDVESALKGQVETLVPRRKTDYGAHEIWVREPSGNIMGFAQFER